MNFANSYPFLPIRAFDCIISNFGTVRLLSFKNDHTLVLNDKETQMYEDYNSDDQDNLPPSSRSLAQPEILHYYDDDNKVNLAMRSHNTKNYFNPKDEPMETQYEKEPGVLFLTHGEVRQTFDYRSRYSPMQQYGEYYNYCDPWDAPIDHSHFMQSCYLTLEDHHDNITLNQVHEQKPFSKLKWTIEYPDQSHASHKDLKSENIEHQGPCTKVHQYFHPHLWFQEEIAFLQTLHSIYGDDWEGISSIMVNTKSAAFLKYEHHRHNKDFRKYPVYDVNSKRCGLCKGELSIKTTIKCECCEETFHLSCIENTYDQNHSKAWFCSKECEKVGAFACQICKKSEGEYMLICDGCDKGYHMYCLKNPLYEVPEDDWFCNFCNEQEEERQSENTCKDKRITSPKHICKHQPNYTSGLREDKLELSAREMGIVQSVKPINWEYLSQMSKQCVDCTIDESGGIIPEDLGKSNESLRSVPDESGNSSIFNDKLDINLRNFGTAIPEIENHFERYLLIVENFLDNLYKEHFKVDLNTSFLPVKEYNNYDHKLSKVNELTDDFDTKSNKTGYLQHEQTRSTTQVESIKRSKVDVIGLDHEHSVTLQQEVKNTIYPDRMNEHHEKNQADCQRQVNNETNQPRIDLNAKLTDSQNDPKSIRIGSPQDDNKSEPKNQISSSSSMPTKQRRSTRVLEKISKITDSNDTTRKDLSQNIMISLSSSRSSKTYSPPRKKAKPNVLSEAKNFWIFQANPKYYNLRSSLQSLENMTWFVKQHTRSIKKGDTVFVWESGKDAGILAVATITEGPSMIEEEPAMESFFKAPIFNDIKLRCRIQIDLVLPRIIKKEHILQHPELKNLSILRAPIGTNFKVLESEAIALEDEVFKILKESCNDTNHQAMTKLGYFYTGNPSQVFSKPSSSTPTKISSMKLSENEKSVKVTSNNILICQSCKKKKISSKAPPERFKEGFWLCKYCSIDPKHFVNMKIIISLRELRLEVQRLCKQKCQLISDEYKHIVKSSQQMECRNVIHAVQGLSECIRLEKNTIVNIAKQAFIGWRENLQRTESISRINH